MSYNGYLIKVGSYEIPHKYINADTYSVYRSIQDVDSYRDANGVLHRNVLSHVPNKVEFDTISKLSNTEFKELMGNIRSNYTNASERKASVEVYIPETDSYVTQDMYMPDIVPKIHDILNGELIYNAIRLAFIGY